MKLFALANVASRRVFEVKPWEFVPHIPDEVKVDKKTFQAWTMNPGTEHCHYSAVEGMDPHCRIISDNVPVFIHGLVVDYDAPVTDEMIERLHTHPLTEFRPNHVSRTFSGYARLVFEFERPLPVNTDILKHFLKFVAKELKLHKLLPGLDNEAFQEPTRYYEVGHSWQHIHDRPIPFNFLIQWMFKATKTVKFTTEYEIPIEKLAAEVESRWPGRWANDFAPGKLGVRFWDPQADCPTGCVVRPQGMYCFTGPKPWVSWKEIFGAAWVEQFEADKLAEIREGVFHDGDKFWRIQPDGTYRSYNATDFARWLKCKGVSAGKSGGDTATELDHVMNNIVEHCGVERALPFVHMPRGPLMLDGRRYLNIAMAKCLDPVPETETIVTAPPERQFPWVYEFLSTLFDPIEQVDYFLGWLKHFYENGLIQQPRPGHAIVVAGPQGRGKTFLTTGLISKMVGGHSDASNYLVEQNPWTDTVAQQPLMCIDDSLGASDARGHIRFSALVKKVVANRVLTYNAKWAKTGEVSWVGRVAITCNLDGESLRIIPNMEMSILDKISLFKTTEKKGMKLPGYYEQQAILNRELPYFCRWLLDWKIPTHVLNEEDPRFGVFHYHHKTLHQAAITQGESHAVCELLTHFLENFKAQYPEKEVWVGTVTMLHKDMSTFGHNFLVSRLPLTRLQVGLRQLQSRGYNIACDQTDTHPVWHIPLELKQRQTAALRPIEIGENGVVEAPCAMPAMLPEAGAVSA